jgi:hypothetical protein
MQGCHEPIDVQVDFGEGGMSANRTAFVPDANGKWPFDFEIVYGPRGCGKLPL